MVKGGNCGQVGPATSAETVLLATQHGSPHPDLDMLVQVFVDELPASAPRPIFDATRTQAGWNVSALVPPGVVSGMAFAAVTDATRGARNA